MNLNLNRDLKTEIEQAKRPLLQKRSHMHNASIIEWLRKRHQNTANVKYLFYPEELQRHLDIQKVFTKFDEDGSGKRDIYSIISLGGIQMSEFYDMLKDADINVFFLTVLIV
jgi:hypothetical protein